jgi:hypothetical protein
VIRDTTAGIRAGHAGCDLEDGQFEPASIGALVVERPGDPLGHQVGVGGCPAYPETLGQLPGVGEVAVVTEGKAGGADLTVCRLGICPVVRARRRISGVPDSEVPVEPSKGGLVEDLRDQSEVLEHGHGLAIRRGDPRRLLTAVLERVQAEVDERGDALAWCVGGENPACLSGPFTDPVDRLLGHVGHRSEIGGTRLRPHIEKRVRYESSSVR